jgi:ribosomal-protein-alanine N-acetyltransferase
MPEIVFLYVVDESILYTTLMSAIPRKTHIPQVPFIRRARKSDIAGIISIERASFVEPWDEETISQSIELFPTSCFVADYQGEVVGFLIGSLQPVDEGFYGHVSNLAVAERCRRRGVGHLLLKRSERQFLLEGALGVQLEVRESNARGRNFYKKEGYEEVFIFPWYYSDNENAIVMMKWFRY